MKKRPAWLEDWLRRHRSRLSIWLHVIGIPLTIAAGVVLVWQLVVATSDPTIWAYWWRPLVLAVIGYGLQWIGHVHEGNDMGEMILIKRWLGMRYTDVSPRYSRD